MLDLEDLVAGAWHVVYGLVDTTVLAHQDWCRDEARSVRSRADFSGGPLGPRCLDANGRDLDLAVSWAWGQCSDTPADPQSVPVPGTAAAEPAAAAATRAPGPRSTS